MTRKLCWSFPVTAFKCKHFQFMTAETSLPLSINVNWTKNWLTSSFINIYSLRGRKVLENGHTPVHIVFQAVSDPVISPLLGLVLSLQWNHPFLAALLAIVQASLLLQKAGFNKRRDYISTVFSFLRSKKHHRKSSWNLLLCPLRFSQREIPLCWFFYSCQKYCFTVHNGPFGEICRLSTIQLRNRVTGVGPGQDVPSPISCRNIGPWSSIKCILCTIAFLIGTLYPLRVVYWNVLDSS